ncbi:MAG: hypothetical protein Phog2KO_13490 [Phototrophicaceae bacterium]
MGKQTTHTHPNSTIYKLQQGILSILIALAGFGAVMFVVIAVVLPAPLFIVMGILVLLLSVPLFMGLLNTPPVIISDEGLLIQGFMGRETQIAWHEIEGVSDYPLLPQANQEILKQYLVGRKKYRAAEGIMLIIPSLPVLYRFAGFLAGEGGQPIIAFTNRKHTDYAILKQRILDNTDPANHTIYPET